MRNNCIKIKEMYKQYYIKVIQQKNSQQSENSSNISDLTFLDSMIEESRVEQIQNSDSDQIINNYPSEFETPTPQDDVICQTVLVLGLTGVGKSSFIRKITGDQSIKSNDSQQSCTQECSLYEKNGIKYIDTPGINDTSKNRYEILLNIVRYLFYQNIKIKDLFFIYVSNKDLQVHQKTLKEFIYTFFLYELFDEKILDPILVERLIGEFQNSNNFLKWKECNYHLKHDDLQVFRQEIFTEKDKALNYIQHANSFHIFVKAFFDKESRDDLEEFDEIMVDFLKEQIWSNIELNNKLYEYQDYISNQETHLNRKIQKILDLENQVQKIEPEKEVQYILLLGQSQVGKSSLIEQLTQLKGLRGNSRQSMTSFCQIYPVEYQNVRYNFIDTPGFEGTEQQSSPFDNLKIIADFLRRNQILEFKILFMRNADKDFRNTLDQIIQKLLIFIKQLFDQETSLVDSDYLNNMLIQDKEINQMEVYNDLEELELMKQKILQVDRISEKVNIGKLYYNKNEIKCVEFNSNYYTKKGKYKKISKEEDEQQKSLLFQGINQISALTVDDKILLKIKKINNFRLIKDKQDYIQQYQLIHQNYQHLYTVIKQIDECKNNMEQEQTDQLSMLIQQKVQILKELENLQFGVIEDYQNDLTVTEIVKSFFNLKVDQGLRQNDKVDNKNDNNNNDKQHNHEFNQNQKQNDILRHFLILYQWPSLLFEQQQNKENMLLSRKQFYFCQLWHYLKPFIDFNNEKHLKVLEELAKLKVIQEITLLQHIQNKCINKYYNQSQDKVYSIIGQAFQGINIIIGTGGQIFRYAAYFSSKAELLIYSYNVIKGINVGLLVVNMVAAALSIGIDIHSYHKRYICGKQMTFNTASNSISAMIGLLAFFVPGYGWAVGGVAAVFGLLGYFVSSQIYTSKKTFDNTIGLFFKSIINEQHKNLQLQNFQKAELLRKELKIQNYSQINQKQGYQLFRELEKQTHTNQENKQILMKLFYNNSNLLDKVSNYLIKEIVSEQFQIDQEAFQIKQQPSESQLKAIIDILKQNKLIVDTFYNRFSHEKLTKLSQSYKKAKNIIKQSTKKAADNLQELNESLQEYQQSLSQFINLIKTNTYTYEQQIEFGNGLLRKGDRFPILFNSYCNLAVIKIKYLYEQKTLSEIIKCEGQKCFKRNGVQNPEESLQLKLNDKEIIENLNLLTFSQKFIESRYLQLLKGQKKPNLTYISSQYNLEGDIAYSIDLLEMAENENQFQPFMNKLEKKLKSNDIENNIRLFDFFNSIQFLKEKFI
ncbi:hypothetical protein ABPG72_015534 [Tetrahymena utriculariae]